MQHAIDQNLTLLQWFEYDKRADLKYKPLSHSEDYEADFNKVFHNHHKNIQKLIEHFRSLKSDYIELVATLYYCWKEIIRNKEKFSEDLLIRRFYHFSTEKIKFKRLLILKAIKWMQTRGIYPT